MTAPETPVGESLAPETPAPADADPHFPALHRVHPRGWLNDPNGIIRHDGRWHVFFQHNPDSARHHLIRWGHMSSPDLVTWRVEPMGPEPRPGTADADGCWSGVATLEDGVPHLVYSGVSGGDLALSRVLVSRGDATMRTWEPLPAVAADVPAEPGIIGVRDPFLFELDSRRLAVQGAGLRRTAADGTERIIPALLAWDRSGLASWTYLGVVLTGEDPIAARHIPAELWECPQLVRLADGDRERWVLTGGKWRQGHDGAPDTLGGVGYVVGELAWDDAAGCPRLSPETGGTVDEGPDFYAPQVCVDGDGAMLWGWSWEGEHRTLEQADEQGWAGCLTFPRELFLRDGLLVSAPVPELAALRGEALVVDDGVLDLPSPARAEVRTRGGVRVDLIGADGAVVRTVAEVGAVAGADETVVLIDASIVELLPTAATPQTVRVHPAAGEHLRVSALGGGSDLGDGADLGDGLGPGDGSGPRDGSDLGGELRLGGGAVPADGSGLRDGSELGGGSGLRAWALRVPAES